MRRGQEEGIVCPRELQRKGSVDGQNGSKGSLLFGCQDALSSHYKGLKYKGGGRGAQLELQYYARAEEKHWLYKTLRLCLYFLSS